MFLVCSVVCSSSSSSFFLPVLLLLSFSSPLFVVFFFFLFLHCSPYCPHIFIITLYIWVRQDGVCKCIADCFISSSSWISLLNRRKVNLALFVRAPKCFWNWSCFIPCSDRYFYCINLNKCHYWEQYFT